MSMPAGHHKHMAKLPIFSRRAMLAGLGCAIYARPLASYAKTLPRAPGPVDGAAFGLMPDGQGDQSEKLQAALATAAKSGLPLFLAGGRYLVGGVVLPAGISFAGVPGATVLAGTGGQPILGGRKAANIALSGLTLDGTGGASDDGAGLLSCIECTALNVENIVVLNGGKHGFLLESCSGRVAGSTFAGHAQAGIFANNSQGLIVAQNTVGRCGNGGILVWRDSPGADGTIVTGNRVTGISAHDGGSGQNGNGINIFRADDVMVSDNVVSDCDFSAIRANTTRDAIIRGNEISDCREVAIYSEFAFSGSEISGNVIDGAAAGISITNSKQGGRLAVCANNVVRNILPNSPTNPDVRPYGISAEADTAITGNTVDNVPGVGISAGWGVYLDNVLIADNVVSNAATGIAVSVADGAGPVRIADNMISGASVAALAGMQWNNVATADLVADASRFPNVALSGNSVSP
jgi:uncharacterized secreted repeat protein (TIGR03808 family)